jgi:hypothetical protein
MQEKTSNLGDVRIPQGNYIVKVFPSGGQEWNLSDSAAYSFLDPHSYIVYNTGDLVEFNSAGQVVAIKTHDGLHYRY